MRYLIALLAIAGIVVSSLALRIHYMDPAAAPPCAVSAHWDCGTVNHGKYSVFPPLGMDEPPGRIHIPVAGVGIVGYALIAAAALLNRSRLVLELARIGFFCALFLSFIETWCIYCVWSAIIITTIFVVSLVNVLLLRRSARAHSTEAVLAGHAD